MQSVKCSERLVFYNKIYIYKVSYEDKHFSMEIFERYLNIEF